jgi:hypothetical protein
MKTMMEISMSTLQVKSQYPEFQINKVKVEHKNKLGKEEEEEKLLKIGNHSNHNYSINSLSKKSMTA